MEVEIWISGVSVFIALCALGLSVWQGHQTRTHNKLSCRPHLTSWSQYHSNKSGYTFELVNHGLGPAIIESFIVTLDGKRVEGASTEVIDKVITKLFDGFQYTYESGFLAKDYSMPVEERKIILSIKFIENKAPTSEAFEALLNRVDLVVSYKSFYEERFGYSTAVERKMLETST